MRRASPTQPLVAAARGDDARARRHGDRGQRGGARQDQPARQPADRARRVRAEADAGRRRSGRRPATSGWRWKRCATPAISAPSSAPPTRSARAGVILVGDTVDPFSVEAVRATMGSIFHVPLARASRAEFAALARRWPRHGRRHASRRRRPTTAQADYRTPVLLVMGGEQAGLTPELAGALRDARQDPDGGQGRLAQPRGRDGGDALRDQARSAEARWLSWRDRPAGRSRSPPSASASSRRWSRSTRSTKAIAEARLPLGEAIDAPADPVALPRAQHRHRLQLLAGFGSLGADRR